jgi:hypothetical protein
MVAFVTVHAEVVVEVCITVWSWDETTIQDPDKTPWRATIVCVREEEVGTTAISREADHSTTVQPDTTIAEDQGCRGPVVFKEPCPTAKVLPIAAAGEGNALQEVFLTMTVVAVVGDAPSAMVIYDLSIWTTVGMGVILVTWRAASADVALHLEVLVMILLMEVAMGVTWKAASEDVAQQAGILLMNLMEVAVGVVQVVAVQSMAVSMGHVMEVIWAPGAAVTTSTIGTTVRAEMVAFMRPIHSTTMTHSL